MPRRGWTTVDVPERWLKVIRGTTPDSARTVRSRVDIFAGVCSGVAPRTRRSQSRVGSRRSGGESIQEDEDIGHPFSGLDDHGPGSADVGAAQRSPEFI